MPWTLERDDALRARISTGQSYSAVAGEMSTLFDEKISRNAVIGRAARIRITVDHRPAPRPARRKSKPKHNFEAGPRESPPKPKAGGRRPRAPTAPPVWMPPESPRKPVPFDMPLVQRCRLLDLNAHTCRWPVGEPEAPDFFFCGGPPVEGHPYCGFHCRVAYRRPGQETSA